MPDEILVIPNDPTPTPTPVPVRRPNEVDPSNPSFDENAPNKGLPETPVVTHGNLNPTPEVAPQNETKDSNGESNVTVPEARPNVIQPQADIERNGLDMAVIGPKNS